jgi:hypothetical protein
VRVFRPDRFRIEHDDVGIGSGQRCRDRGVHVVLVGHSTIRKFEAPDAAGAYDRFELKLAKQVAALVKEWVDALLFVNFVTCSTSAMLLSVLIYCNLMYPF